MLVDVCRIFFEKIFVCDIFRRLTQQILAKIAVVCQRGNPFELARILDSFVDFFLLQTQRCDFQVGVNSFEFNVTGERSGAIEVIVLQCLEDFPRTVGVEHFGMTTVEAMSAGCIPVVIDKGGQREIVAEGCGFRWNTLSELVARTEELVLGGEHIEKIRKNARERAQLYSKSAFTARLRGILSEAGIA